jgi:hypothetical protein
MHPSLVKSRIFTAIALIILTLSYTFPMIAFHGTLNKVEAQKSDEVSSLSKTVWNLYNQGRYKSVTTPKESHNDLKKMIETAKRRSSNMDGKGKAENLIEQLINDKSLDQEAIFDDPAHNDDGTIANSNLLDLTISSKTPE